MLIALLGICSKEELEEEEQLEAEEAAAEAARLEEMGAPSPTGMLHTRRIVPLS